MFKGQRSKTNLFERSLCQIEKRIASRLHRLQKYIESEGKNIS